MAAYLCLIALIFVVINLVVDLLYFAVDPRLRVETTGAARIDSVSFTRKAPMKRIAPSAARRARSRSPHRWRTPSPFVSPTWATSSRWIRTRSTRACS